MARCVPFAPGRGRAVRCAYCGGVPAREYQGAWVCEGHEDLPELERARLHLEWKACRHFDGHTQYWNGEDAHAVKVLLRAVEVPT